MITQPVDTTELLKRIDIPWYNPQNLTPENINAKSGWRFCLEEELPIIAAENLTYSPRKFHQFLDTYVTREPLPAQYLNPTKFPDWAPKIQDAPEGFQWVVRGQDWEGPAVHTWAFTYRDWPYWQYVNPEAAQPVGYRCLYVELVPLQSPSIQVKIDQLPVYEAIKKTVKNLVIAAIAEERAKTEKAQTEKTRTEKRIDPVDNSKKKEEHPHFPEGCVVKTSHSYAMLITKRGYIILSCSGPYIGIDSQQGLVARGHTIYFDSFEQYLAVYPKSFEYLQSVFKLVRVIDGCTVTDVDQFPVGCIVKRYTDSTYCLITEKGNVIFEPSMPVKGSCTPAKLKSQKYQIAYETFEQYLKAHPGHSYQYIKQIFDCVAQTDK